MKPMVLALDLSTHTGWALGRDFEKPRHGVWELGRMSNLGRCFSCLAAQLEGIISLERPDKLIFEAPLPQQKRDTQQLARLLIGLAAVTEMIAYEQGIQPTEQFPNEVRKAVFGTAAVDKTYIVNWCRGQGWQPVDDNDADALVLLRYQHTLDRSRVMAGAGSV
jgi:hypothetical protein